MRKSVLLLMLGLTLVLAGGTFLLPGVPAYSQGGGNQHPGVSVEAGYRLEVRVQGLDFPTAVTFFENRMWVSEAGVVSGTVPKVKEVDNEGNATTVLSPQDLPHGVLAPPLTDVTFHEGMLWITHRQKGVHDWNVGAISKFDPNNPAGTFATVITNLPSSGDHHTDKIIFDNVGRAYFSQGSTTNASVVGPDNLLATGWLDMFPDFHDFPAQNIVLNGREITTDNPLTRAPDDTALTPPFMPFNSGPIDVATEVPGASALSPQEGIIAGNGTVYSFDPSHPAPTSTLRLEAWGLRNPFGIAFDPDNPKMLFSANNGADIRSMQRNNELIPVGARPIANDFDDLFVIPVGGQEEFFGWPDFFHDPQNGEVLPVTDPLFCQAAPEPEITCPGFVMDQNFREGLQVQPAVAQFENHSSANRIAFSTSEDFGFVTDIFVVETGAFVPQTGATQFTGYKVVRVHRENGVIGDISDFIVNEGTTPEEVFNPDSFNKPIDIEPRGNSMVIVDFGIFEPGLKLQQPGTGKIWVVTHQD